MHFLIHEGQLINNIIFVKEGSLALEACIDINEPYKSVKKYLNKNFGDIFEDAVIVSDYNDSFDVTKMTGNNYHNIFNKAKNELNSCATLTWKIRISAYIFNALKGKKAIHNKKNESVAFQQLISHNKIYRVINSK